MLYLYIDADSCTVKEECCRVARRYDLSVTFVSNTWMRTPNENKGVLKIVEGDFDAADNWIVEKVQADDIVITADIPLADRCLKKNAAVLGPRGRPFNENNIGDVLASRNLLADMRETGAITGGPAPFQKKDRSQFLQKLDEIIQNIRRRHE